jgi:hypothetical protein
MAKQSPDWERNQLRRMALAISKSLKADDRKKGIKRTDRQRMSASFAIAKATLNKYGYMVPGKMKATAKGRRAAHQKTVDQFMPGRFVQYEDALAKARGLNKQEREVLRILNQVSLSPSQLRGAANQDVCGMLFPLRQAMETVFTCKTVYGDCRPKLPAAGHCFMAALAVQDIFGGHIIMGEESNIPHYWNAVGNKQIDITGDQFFRPPVQCGPWEPSFYNVKHRYKRNRHQRPGSKSHPAMKRYEIFRKKLAKELRKEGHGPWAEKLEVMK